MIYKIETQDNFDELYRMVLEIYNRFQLSKTKESKLLTSKEVCAKLGISTRTLQNLRDGGKIKFVQANGSRTIRYSLSHIEEYLEKNIVRNRSA